MESNSLFWPATSFSNHIFDVGIPREQRLRSIKFGVDGTIETTNFFFSFRRGKIWEIERLSQPEVEYYANDLDKLIGKPSQINDSQAHGLATQWLAAVDIDVPALEKKYPSEINCLRYLPKGATNVTQLPFYFVHWGWQYFTNNDNNHTVSSTPLVEVKILGTTKELVELHMLDTSFSRRPLLLISNALDLIRAPNPTVKHLQMNPQHVNSRDFSSQTQKPMNVIPAGRSDIVYAWGGDDFGGGGFAGDQPGAGAISRQSAAWAGCDGAA